MQEQIYKAKIEKYNSIKFDEILFKIWLENEIEKEYKTAFLLNIHLFNLFIDKETEKIRGMKIENIENLIVYWKEYENILKYYKIMKKYIGNEYFE